MRIAYLSFCFRCDKFLEEMFGCETSLVDIILNSLLADTTSSAPGKGADKQGGKREGHSKPVSRLPRHHCDKSHKGTIIMRHFIPHTHTYTIRTSHLEFRRQGCRSGSSFLLNADPNPHPASHESDGNLRPLFCRSSRAPFLSLLASTVNVHGPPRLCFEPWKDSEFVLFCLPDKLSARLILKKRSNSFGTCLFQCCGFVINWAPGSGSLLFHQIFKKIFIIYVNDITRVPVPFWQHIFSNLSRCFSDPAGCIIKLAFLIRNSGLRIRGSRS